METIYQEFTRGMPEGQHLVQVLIRLVAAVIIGGMIGFERQRAGKSAGLRTHILVALSTALFVIASVAGGLSPEGTSRVIQGIATGIGFLGAGAILKISDETHIRGLTTAAGIWMTAALGVTIGLGMIGIALIAAVLALLVLSALRRYEHKSEN